MLIELFIETLTGAAFELRVSPFETVLSVKAKIQRQEGIPVGQQHLIWQEHELDDEVSLHEASVPCGGTLRLVLGMRGGPINTRRIPVEPPSWSDDGTGHSIADIMWPGSSSKQVTLLVLREGDQFNFFRVMDRGDGTLTPVAEALSAGSKRRSRDATDEEPSGFSGNDEDSSDESSASANRHSSGVGSGFRAKRHGGGPVESSNALRRSPSTSIHSHETIPPGAFSPQEHNSVSSNNSLHLKMRMLQQKMGQMRLNRRSLRGDHGFKLAPLLPTTSKKEVSGQTSSSSFSTSCSPLNSSQHDASITTSQDRGIGLRQQRRELSNVVGSKVGDTKSNSVNSVATASHGISVPQAPSLMSSSQARSYPNIACLPSKLITPSSSSLKKSSAVATSSGTSSRLLSGKSDQLPPVLLSTRHSGNGGISTFVARSQRCFHCQKKTGLANTYQCRCGNSFCARHRYAETHDCPYDYKAEGRKLIEEANPVITASKLPKI